jgi:hypothetical protein
MEHEYTFLRFEVELNLPPNVAYQSAAKKKGAPKGALAAPTRAVRSREGDGRSVPFPAGSAPVRGA